MREPIVATITGVVSEVLVSVGQKITDGDNLITIESMKMETVITAHSAGIVREIKIDKGDMIEEGATIMTVEKSNSSNSKETPPSSSQDRKSTPSSLQELRDRRLLLQDDARPEAMAKRKSKGHLTARESIAYIIDTDSWTEYGSMVVAAQRTRRAEEDLIKNTPADGLICGTASINRSTVIGRPLCMVMAYDYTVLAGTQGAFNHLKMDRMLDIARERQLPVLLLAEGGGGRPGDIDHQVVAGLHVMTFYKYAALDGIVPRIAVVTGYCFAGNAALAGSSDIVIATKLSSMGMGGPAMVSGGGLGEYHPRNIGPSSVQSTNGVIDILVESDEEAMATARKLLSYFQGKKTTAIKTNDQTRLLSIIPAERRRVYQIREIVNTIADVDSVIELQSGFAPSVVTSFIRIAGQPYGLIANDCRKDAGAITSDACDKLGRFLSLCDKHSLALISLVDCPGFMVGPSSEAQGAVRAAGRLFNISAKLTVPIISIILRRGFGLGAMAMTGGSFHASRATVAWPSAQCGAMGIEGAVKLGFKKELEAISDPQERQALYDKMVSDMYHQGRAINMAAYLEIDEVISPEETRDWIIGQFT